MIWSDSLWFGGNRQAIIYIASIHLDRGTQIRSGQVLTNLPLENCGTKGLQLKRQFQQELSNVQIVWVECIRFPNKIHTKDMIHTGLKIVKHRVGTDKTTRSDTRKGGNKVAHWFSLGLDTRRISSAANQHNMKIIGRC